MGFSIALAQLKRKKRADGRIPIYIRVTKDRKHRYKVTGISVSEEHWDSEYKLVTDSHRHSIRFNRQLQQILSLAYDRVELLLDKGDPSLDELKEVLAEVVEEFHSPKTSYSSRASGKALESAKRIVIGLEDRGLIADQFFFHNGRIIAYSKDKEEGEDIFEVSDTTIIPIEELADLYDNPTLLKDTINEITDDINRQVEALIP